MLGGACFGVVINWEPWQDELLSYSHIRGPGIGLKSPNIRSLRYSIATAEIAVLLRQGGCWVANCVVPKQIHIISCPLSIIWRYSNWTGIIRIHSQLHLLATPCYGFRSIGKSGEQCWKDPLLLNAKSAPWSRIIRHVLILADLLFSHNTFRVGHCPDHQKPWGLKKDQKEGFCLWFIHSCMQLFKEVFLITT